MTSDMASIHFITAWPFMKQNCLPLHISNNIALHIEKGGWCGARESLDCLWSQYRFYTAPRKRELHLKLQRCLCELSTAGVI